MEMTLLKKSTVYNQYNKSTRVPKNYGNQNRYTQRAFTNKKKNKKKNKQHKQTIIKSTQIKIDRKEESKKQATSREDNNVAKLHITLLTDWCVKTEQRANKTNRSEKAMKRKK